MIRPILMMGSWSSVNVVDGDEAMGTSAYVMALGENPYLHHGQTATHTFDPVASSWVEQCGRCDIET